jgi:hypothetical protein
MTPLIRKGLKKRTLPGLIFRPKRPSFPCRERKRLSAFDGRRMTVGIAAYCESFQNIKLAADCRASYQNPHLKPHDEMGKQFRLPFGLYADIAGSFAHCESLIAYLNSEMEKLKDKPEVLLGHIRDAVYLAQGYELRFRCEVRFRSELSMSVEEWKKELQISPWLPYHIRLYKTGRAIFRSTSPRIELIVAGYTKDSEVLLSTAFKEPPEIESSFTTIGSGGEDALIHLDFRKQNPHYSFPRTVLHVAEALEKAKTDPAVGAPGDYVILRRGETRRFKARDPFVLELIERYANRDTAEIDNDDEIRMKLKGLIYKEHIPGPV